MLELLLSYMTIEQRIVYEARIHDVNPIVALRIADCESSLNPRAQNPKSTAKGLYQWTDTTWKWIGAKGQQFDVNENIHQFMIWYKVYPSWWECR